MSARDVKEGAQPVDFLAERLAPVPCQSIVPASLVDVPLRRWRLFHPSAFHKSPQRAVNRPGPEAKPVARLALHVLENGVAVTLASRESKQDVDDGWRQRRHLPVTDISATGIVVKRCSGLNSHYK